LTFENGLNALFVALKYATFCIILTLIHSCMNHVLTNSHVYISSLLLVY